MAADTSSRPKLTPDLQALFDAIRYMDEYRKPPETTGDTGRYKHHVKALVEELRCEGFEAYQKERARFFNEDKYASAMFATYGAPEPEQKEDKRFIPGPDGKRIIKFHSVEDIYSLPDPDYLIRLILESIGVSLMYGLSGTGKTFSALHIALSIAHGLFWMGRHVKQGIVWYINTEGGRSLKKRLKAWYQEHDDLSPTPNFKVIPWSLDLRDNFQDLLNTLDAMSEHEKPTIIIFDNFSMCTSGLDQTKQEQVAPILRILNDLAQDRECHIMVLHHTNKENDVNGSMAFRNHVDTMIELKREDRADKNSPILFTCQKARDDEPFSPIKTELKQVTLYTDPVTLETVTSCVVVESEAPIKQLGLKDTAQNIFDLLGDTPRSYTDWKKEAMDALHISKATFDRYRDELLAKQYIEKCKVDGIKFEQYRKVENLAREDAESEKNGE
jgi:hypothetical protein